MTTNQRRVNYLVKWLFYAYCKNLNQDPVKPEFFTTYPLSDILSNDETSPKDMFYAVLKELSKYVSQETNAEFWYSIIDWISANQSFVNDCNGKRLLEEIKRQIIYNDGYLSDGVLSIAHILFNRIEIRSANPHDEAVEAKSKEMFQGVVNYINAFALMLPNRPTYWRFNYDGKLEPSRDSRWDLVGTHRDWDPAFTADKSVLHYGIELEGAFPSRADFEACCEKLLQEGIINKDRNLVVPTSDGSISGRFPVEWNTAPLSFAECIEVLPKFVTILHDHGFSHTSEENDAGMHIHFDRHFFTGHQLIAINNKIKAIVDKEAFFGRGDNSWAPWDYDDTYRIIRELVACGEVDPITHKVMCEEKIEIKGLEKYALVNFNHANSVEIRGYNASYASDIVKHLTALNELLMSVKEGQ